MSSREVDAPAGESLFAELVKGNRRALSRAITLVESGRRDDREQADALLVLARSRGVESSRVGITGAPGAGKSTLIDALGNHLVNMGKKVAVLSVDPSSTRSGGSLLADKTRMSRLAASENAYIRPSPSGGLLGGIARNTADAVLLCEAAGFDVVIVETVGTGQSEVSVANVVHSFVVLIVPGAGDEIQGMKRGVLELADVVVVTKADGENVRAAESARVEHEIALRWLSGEKGEPAASVISVSAREGKGVQQMWQVICEQRARTPAAAASARRSEQRVAWFRERLELGLYARFRELPRVRNSLGGIEEAVRRGELAPEEAASRVLALLT